VERRQQINRFYYHRPIREFILDSDSSILGELANAHEFALEDQQRNAWNAQIRLLKSLLATVEGHVILEYSIPRMGKRIDCVILSGSVVFAIEFKVGATTYASHAIDQVMDYALDLKNFHAATHHRKIVPILLCTQAEEEFATLQFYEDGVANVILTNGGSLARYIGDATRHPTFYDHTFHYLRSIGLAELEQ
jgi:hypothetical protein